MSWPKPPPNAVKVLLAALRSTCDSGGVSACGLLGFGFDQNQADAWFMPGGNVRGCCWPLRFAMGYS
jgi:hypothetical protein